MNAPDTSLRRDAELSRDEIARAALACFYWAPPEVTKCDLLMEAERIAQGAYMIADAMLIEGRR